MITNKSNLACSLFPEWAPQSGVMLTWPHQKTLWANMLDSIDRVFVEVAKEITLRQSLLISCFDHAHQEHVLGLLKQAGVNLSKVVTLLVPSNDIWVRDHGPLSALSGNQPILLDFVFNGWGRKYPFELDNNLTRSLHSQKAFGATPIFSINMVLEGGSIEVDGQGTLLTTSSCLLAKSRNPLMTQEEIAIQLQHAFGIKRILWLDHGHLSGDDTDGHIDTLARFTDPHTICYVRCTDPQDEHFEHLLEMEKQLRTFKDYQENPYRLIPLPWPKPQYAHSDRRRLPATYANFLIINDAVLVPTYNDPSDQDALDILASCFPDRQIIGIHSVPVIQWNGSLHCMTMQLPKGVFA